MSLHALRFVQFRDPNEALGLAVRLLAGAESGPFDNLPLGMSARLLSVLIDRGDYGFAQRENLATGFCAWSFMSEALAEAHVHAATSIRPEDLGSGRAGVVFAFRAIDRATTRFMTKQLRNVVLRDAESLRFIRDYGPHAERLPRAVTMRRAWNIESSSPDSTGAAERTLSF